MFKSLSLKAKLLSLAFGMAFALALVGAISYYSLNDIISKYSHVADINFNNYQAVSEMRDSQRMMAVATFRIMSLDNDPVIFEKQVKTINSAKEKFAKNKKTTFPSPLEKEKMKSGVM